MADLGDRDGIQRPVGVAACVDDVGQETGRGGIDRDEGLTVDLGVRIRVGVRQRVGVGIGVGIGTRDWCHGVVR